jgi:predicted PurR-regulated permease PerM
LKKFGKRLWNSIISLLAGIGLLLGIALIFSPFPIGVILIAISLSVLIYVNDGVQNLLREIRTEYDHLNEKLHWLEDKSSERARFVSDALGKTRPDLQADSD